MPVRNLFRPIAADRHAAPSARTAARAIRKHQRVQRVLSAFGRIDSLVNIAGAVPQIDLFEMTDDQWESGLALKLHGARRLTIEAWAALKDAKGSWY